MKYLVSFTYPCYFHEKNGKESLSNIRNVMERLVMDENREKKKSTMTTDDYASHEP